MSRENSFTAIFLNLHNYIFRPSSTRLKRCGMSTGVGGRGYTSVLLSRTWLWGVARLRQLQQVSQQRVQVIKSILHNYYCEKYHENPVSPQCRFEVVILSSCLAFSYPIRPSNIIICVNSMIFTSTK